MTDIISLICHLNGGPIYLWYHFAISDMELCSSACSNTQLIDRDSRTTLHNVLDGWYRIRVSHDLDWSKIFLFRVSRFYSCTFYWDKVGWCYNGCYNGDVLMRFVIIEKNIYLYPTILLCCRSIWIINVNLVSLPLVFMNNKSFVSTNLLSLTVRKFTMLIA